MPPVPSSSIISYLSANKIPLASSSTGVSRVLVKAGLASWTGVSWVPQSPQNCWVLGLSALHFGHFVATSSPCVSRQNIIKESGRCQIELMCSYSFNPASLFLASSTSAMPGSASFQRERNFLFQIHFLQQRFVSRIRSDIIKNRVSLYTWHPGVPFLKTFG